MSFACLAEEGHDGGMDADYASAASEADDEATLEEEDAMAAQDGIDQKVSPSAGAVTGQSGNPRNIHLLSQSLPPLAFCFRSYREYGS